MGRRLEKDYLVCNTAFLSLFAMKFVQYLGFTFLNFRYISEIYEF